MMCSEGGRDELSLLWSTGGCTILRPCSRSCTVTWGRPHRGRRVASGQQGRECEALTDVSIGTAWRSVRCVGISLRTGE
jgi:hypothetical protein